MTGWARSLHRAIGLHWRSRSHQSSRARDYAPNAFEFSHAGRSDGCRLTGYSAPAHVIRVNPTLNRTGEPQQPPDWRAPASATLRSSTDRSRRTRGLTGITVGRTFHDYAPSPAGACWTAKSRGVLGRPLGYRPHTCGQSAALSSVTQAVEALPNLRVRARCQATAPRCSRVHVK